jgi:hypothetical protein
VGYRVNPASYSFRRRPGNITAVAFWLGWVLNLGLALYLAAIVIWLEFFWHW